MANAHAQMNAAQLAELLKGLSPILPPKDAVDPPILDIQEAPNTGPPSKRCGCCRKKLTLSDFDCGKCKTRFCSLHRLPEQHSCGHDFTAEGKKLLEKQLTKVVADKLERV
jgi:hypothetical protein